MSKTSDGYSFARFPDEGMDSAVAERDPSGAVAHSSDSPAVARLTGEVLT